MYWNLIVVKLILLNISWTMCQNSEIKRTRRPNRFDHLLCKQKYSGFGIRSSAVLNYSGQLCKTYCRVINRVNRTASFTENVSPNNIRCGPLGARCIEGVCTPSGSAGSSSGAITQVASNSRKGRPVANDRKRVRPPRKGSPDPQKTTSISTIEMTDFIEKETETATNDVVVNQNDDTDSNNAKIVFPNE